MTRVKWTIHPVRNSEDGGYPVYALLPDDDTRGLLIGEPADIQAVYDCLDRFLETGEHDGEVPKFSEQLGHRWLYTRDALEEYGVPIPSTTLACRDGKIADAHKTRYGWQFSVKHLLAWMEQRPGPGRPRKERA